MGEAAGTASALSIEEGISVREIAVKKIQEKLLAHGAIIDPVPVPAVEAYPEYESPLKRDPSLLEKYIK
jgi:hypothetical protein